MFIKNVNLVSVDGSNATSVELSNRKAMCAFFGTWFKEDCTFADVVSWCDKLEAQYVQFRANLANLRDVCRKEMVSGMDLGDLEAILIKLKAEQAGKGQD